MLSSIFGIGAVLSVVAASAALLNDYLPQRLKKYISDKATDAFIWLDDQRELRYVPYIRKPILIMNITILAILAVIALIMAVFVSYGMYTGEFGAQTDEVEGIRIPKSLPYQLLGGYVGSFLAFFVTLLMIPRLLRWVTYAGGCWSYVGRSSAILVFTVAVSLALLLLLGTLLSGEPPKEVVSDPVAQIDYIFGEHPFLLSFYYGVALAFVFVVALIWLCINIPASTILALMGIFRLAQFVAEVVAETPKGPAFLLAALFWLVRQGARLLGY